jgi:hypothetical protein
MAYDWTGIDLRSSADAKRLQVRPCRFEGEEDPDNVITCTPTDATFWGVYYSEPLWTHCPGDAFISLADFDTEAEALAFAIHIANGRHVYAFDTANGERLA